MKRNKNEPLLADSSNVTLCHYLIYVNNTKIIDMLYNESITRGAELLEDDSPEPNKFLIYPIRRTNLMEERAVIVPLHTKFANKIRWIDAL